MTSANLSHRNLTVLVIGFLVLFVTGGSRFAIGLVLKPMVEDLGWNRGDLGAAAAVFLVVSSICMFISGRLSDRYSMRIVLISGLVFSAAGISAMNFVTEPWQALLYYGVIFAVGNGLASIAPVGVLVSRWFPGRIGFANAFTTSGIGIGQLLIIGSLAAALAGIGWRQAYIWLGVVNLALIPVVLVIVGQKSAKPPSPPPEIADRSTTLRQALQTPRMWALVFVYAVCGFQDFFVATHVVAFAQDRGVETLMAGNLLAFMGLAGVIGVLVAGAWSDRTGPHQATFACFVLRIAIFGLILFDQSTLSVALFAMLYGITFWSTAPLTVVFARNAFGMAHLGAISGLIVMIHHMSGGLGAYLGAVMFDLQGNYDMAFALMLALSIAAAATSASLFKSERKQ